MRLLDICSSLVVHNCHSHQLMQEIKYILRIQVYIKYVLRIKIHLFLPYFFKLASYWAAFNHKIVSCCLKSLSWLYRHIFYFLRITILCFLRLTKCSQFLLKAFLSPSLLPVHSSLCFPHTVSPTPLLPYLLMQALSPSLVRIRD